MPAPTTEQFRKRLYAKGRALLLDGVRIGEMRVRAEPYGSVYQAVGAFCGEPFHTPASHSSDRVLDRVAAALATAAVRGAATERCAR